MLSFGFTEILLIGALLLVVVGPDRLPQVMRWAGRSYGKVRRAADELRHAFVLEADRQDAEARLEKLRERQARARAQQEAAERLGGAAQPRHLPPAPDVDEAPPGEDAPGGEP